MSIPEGWSIESTGGGVSTYMRERDGLALCVGNGGASWGWEILGADGTDDEGVALLASDPDLVMTPAQAFAACELAADEIVRHRPVRSEP